MHHLRLFCFGQSIALSLALVSSASSIIEAQCGVVIPVTMSGLCYLILSLHLIDFKQLFKRGKITLSTLQHHHAASAPGAADVAAAPHSFGLHATWWGYVFIAFLDVEANFVFMQAFRYTSLTSAQLLSSLAVPSAMIFSWLILQRKFRLRHYVGALTCIVGGMIIILSDKSRGANNPSSYRDGESDNNNDDTEDAAGGRYQKLHPHSFLGDLFAVLGALLYGLTDTIAEHFVKHVSRVEYLGMLGLFGSIISLIQAAIFEWDDIQAIVFSDDSTMTTSEQRNVLLTVSWYVVCLAYVYIGFSHFLEVADVTLLILSLQTSQLYCALFSILAQRISPLPSFYVAVVFMVSGVFIYESGLGKGGITEKESSSSTNSGGGGGDDDVSLHVASKSDCEGYKVDYGSIEANE